MAALNATGVVMPDRAECEAVDAWLRARIPTGLQEVCKLASDSRAIRPGDVFLAYPGARVDGRKFIPDVIAAGAAAVLWDDGRDNARDDRRDHRESERRSDPQPFVWDATWTTPNRPVHDLKAAAGEIAANWHGRPAERLRIVGVTGTSGKSSCAFWIAQALTALGQRCAVAGTLGIGFVPEGSTAALHDTGKTTPDAVELQAELRQLVDKGAVALAIEVSSIGLVEGRVNGMKFDVGLFTNFSRDHLDYHQTMDAYAAAKARLFDWPRLGGAVINLDDPAAAHMEAAAIGNAAMLLRYSARGAIDADLRATDVEVATPGMRFTVHGPFGQRRVETTLIGAYNVANLLGVLGVLLLSGHDADAALAALARLVPAPGRLEQVQGAPGTPGPLVLVDYAHKPDALEKVLEACRPLATARAGRLIVVFGCGGDRDSGKRALMGAIAARLADQVVVTSDNPRSEEPQAIIAQIVAGAATTVLIEVDRRSALRMAIGAAADVDVILIAGKGHEAYQEIAGERLPFSDVAEARAALQERTAC